VRDTRRLWDISPPVSPGAPVFPGDTPFEQRWSATLGPDSPVNVATITLSPHVGAHADAPLHYAAGGASAGELALAPFLGPCRVVHAIGVMPLIRPEHLAPFVHDGGPPRVLVRTCRRVPTAWTDDFAAFDPATIDWLADRGVVLVGLDTASVDPASSRTLDSHQRLRARGLRVLENLVLDEVEAGDYELIALPLKLVGCDASPVRAVLRR
jgi:arylformamidase